MFKYSWNRCISFLTFDLKVLIFFWGERNFVEQPHIRKYYFEMMGFAWLPWIVVFQFGYNERYFGTQWGGAAKSFEMLSAVLTVLIKLERCSVGLHDFALLACQVRRMVVLGVAISSLQSSCSQARLNLIPQSSWITSSNKLKNWLDGRSNFVIQLSRSWEASLF